MKEIKNTKGDIENFREGNYKDIVNRSNLDLSKISRIRDRTGVSKLSILEALGEDLLTEE